MTTSIILPYRDISPKIDDTAFIAPNTSIVGDVEIGSHSNIWYGCTLRGDVHEIRIGKRSNIQDGSVIHTTSDVSGTYIGDDVTVGHACVLHACTLENYAFIGMQSCLLDEAHVESFGMLAAGSLLTPGKRVPSGQLWGGSPARYMRDLTSEEIEMIKKSAPHYVELGQEHKAEINKL
ncbi:MAG: gamma carbonic anhydrase family protein [Alphaproteobacteria bacterium]|nr:gamma carbonic anhydrase family protein [Alphaproteobacteria bacterium]